MKTKTKPKYNLLQNSAYMVGNAWRVCKNVLVLVMIQIALGVAANLLSLYVAPTILQAVETAPDIGSLMRVILLFSAALILTGAATAYVDQNTLFGRIQVRTNFTTQIHNKFCLTSYPHTEDPDFIKMAEKAIRVTSGNTDATEAIWETLVELFINIISFCFYLILLTHLSPVIIIVILATAAVSYYISLHFNSWCYEHREEESEYENQTSYIRGKSRSGICAKDIRIFGLGNWLEEVYEKAFRLLEDFNRKAEKTAFLADIADAAMTLLRSGVAYGYLIGQVIGGELSAPEFLLYFTAISGFTSWVTGILTGMTTLSRQSLDICAMREYLEAEDSFRFEDGTALEPQQGKDYELELKDVSFRYPGAEKDTLSHINLTIRPGEKLAVVGLNGAGKTTLIKLLCGFYDPTKGQVLLNGQDIRPYNRRDYYRHFSAVFQDFSLLPGTVMENVAQNFTGIDPQKVYRCLERAGLKDRIEALPHGLETHLGKEVYNDAVELSGGETQRLMLARALYKDAPIIVLDEPTAALDPIAENDIYQRYSDLTAGCTSVYISHRLASTRFCDRIILIQDGGIAEEGTHESLMQQGGRYAELFEIQSRYYKTEGAEDYVTEE